MSERHLTCAECDELFPDYFEGELDAARSAMVDAHASSCARCQGLIRDIRAISQSAASLSDLAPSRDLWKGIEERIQPAVVPIGQRREGIHVSRRLLGIAAAALVVISSSITYVATRGTAPSGKRAVRVVEAPRDIPVPGSSDEIASPAPPIAAPSTSSGASAPSTSNARRTTPAAKAPRQPSFGGATSGSSRNSLAANRATTAGERAIAPEIEQLQALLKERRSQLDPSTVKIVEDNLALIDAAVKQAREALMKDPASGFLTQQLDGALQKKVQLLRTVATLPSRS
jgi:anti-sigma factor ChrR (cupin superfamily)